MQQNTNILRGRPWLLLLLLFAWLLPQEAAADWYVQRTYQYQVMLNGANTIRIKAPVYDEDEADHWVCNGNLYVTWTDDSGTEQKLSLINWGFNYKKSGSHNNSHSELPVFFSTKMGGGAGIELTEGYTMYQDGYSSPFFNDSFYQAAQQMDQAGDMHFVLGTAWEMDSWMDVDKTLEKAADTKKYESTHIRTNWLKMFMDGTVESGTGFVDPLYADGHQGIPNWSEEELTDITRKANEKGITMHVHVMGNKGVERIVNAFINGGKDEMRNTLVHVYGVKEADYKRMADHNIYVTSGMLWHHA